MDKQWKKLTDKSSSYFTLDDLFEVLPKSIMPKDENRRYYTKKVFLEFFFFMLEDIVENSTTFITPKIHGNYLEFYMKQYEGEEFAEKYREGCWKGLDYIKSGFTGNQLRCKIHFHSGTVVDRRVHFYGELKDKLWKYTEQSKVYY